MTTTFKPPKVSEPLIDENNYHSWAKELLRALRTIELEEYITEAHKDAPADRLKTWQKNIDRVINTLLINCEKEPQQLIRGCDTAYEAWELLKKHYEGRTRMHLTSLLLNITTMRLDDRATTINEHIMTFDSDAWKATLLLGTLPKIQLYQNIASLLAKCLIAPAWVAESAVADATVCRSIAHFFSKVMMCSFIVVARSSSLMVVMLRSSEVRCMRPS